jgi:hypothetical protein
LGIGGDSAVGVFELSGWPLLRELHVCVVKVGCIQQMDLGFAHSDKDCDVLHAVATPNSGRSRDIVSWSEQGWSGADFAEESENEIR